MARRAYCIPCGRERRDVEAVGVVDGDPVCAAHAGLMAKGIEVVPDVSRDVSAAPHVRSGAGGYTRELTMAAESLSCFGTTREARECRHPECTRILANSNTSGVCSTHFCWGRTKAGGALGVRIAAVSVPDNSSQCRHPDCDKRLKSNNRRGVCTDHGPWGHRNPVDGPQLQDGTKCRHPECESRLRGIVRLRSTVCVEHYTWSRSHPLNPRLPKLRRAA